MPNNELVKITSMNQPKVQSEIQYVDVKRIIPQNHPSLKVLRFYNNIMRIMNEPVGETIDYKA